MKTIPILSVVLASIALSACTSVAPGGGGPVVPPVITNISGQATHVGAVYSATQAGVLTAIPGGPSTNNGQPLWFNTATSTAIVGYESANALALAGFNTGGQIRGLTGALTTTPLTGSAVYTGRFSYGTSTGSFGSGVLALNVDFAAGTISGNSGGALSVNANITPGTGNQFTGTASFSIAGSKPLVGGFFGTNELVGTFGDASVAGVIYGSAP